MTIAPRRKTTQRFTSLMYPHLGRLNKSLRVLSNPTRGSAFPITFDPGKPGINHRHSILAAVFRLCVRKRPRRALPPNTRSARSSFRHRTLEVRASISEAEPLCGVLFVVNIRVVELHRKIERAGGQSADGDGELEGAAVILPLRIGEADARIDDLL